MIYRWCNVLLPRVRNRVTGTCSQTLILRHWRIFFLLSICYPLVNTCIDTCSRITDAWSMDFVSSSPVFSTTPLFSKFSYKSFLFQNVHNLSFFLHLTISVDVIHHDNTCILCPHFFDWYSIREKVCNSIFIFRAISLTLVGKPQCFLHFFPCLHMALSYQTVSKTLT